MINTAKTYIGYLEHANSDLLGVYTGNVGKGGCTIFSHIINRFYRWRNFSGVPWCAVFVHAVCLDTYGKEFAKNLLGKPHPGTRVLARRMKRQHRLLGRNDLPCPNDIIFLHNGNGVISHCGIVAAVDSDFVISIEGNTIDPTGVFPKNEGGAVAIRRRKLSDNSIVGYGHISDKINDRRATNVD